MNISSKLKGLFAAAVAAVGITAFAEPGAVQLWADGPYFATCNVGAEKPEEYGYYFWWGDTVGYKHDGSKWVSVKDGTTTIQFSSSDTTAKQTYDKSVATLKSEKWIDDSGNLVVSDDAATNRDAARAHLGGSWRMMTKDELNKLVSTDYCQRTWVTKYKGVTVKGYVVKGKAGSAYENNEVFFPAAGLGSGSDLVAAGSRGDYWSSTPFSDSSDNYARSLFSVSSDFNAAKDDRYFGLPVRAVRDTPLMPSVEITEAYQQTPGSGIVDYTYTVKEIGDAKYNLNIKVGAKGCAKTETVTIEKVAAGTATASVDVKKLLGNAYPNVTLFAELVDWVPPAGQLWEDGPIFAECNVGASKPEEYGYYFWWGDTVGYKLDGSKWVSVVNGTTTIQFSYSDATATQTRNHDNTWLTSNKWIDDSGNLVVSDDATNRDAARAHLHASWRMPTVAELQKLVSTDYCECTKTTNWEGTGKAGCVFTGKGAYAANSVFFPYGGMGDEARILSAGSYGYYWSSVPNSGDFQRAGVLSISSGTTKVYDELRSVGCSVRAVRDAK